MRTRAAASVALLASLALCLRSPARAVEPSAAIAPSSGEAKTGAAAASGELQFVVALQRHGIRTPLKGFMDSTSTHSVNTWPAIEQWKVRAFDRKVAWGDLTQHGFTQVTAMGVDYAKRYRSEFGAGFKVGLWADEDNRTIQTAQALASGFRLGGVSAVSIATNLATGKVDPLFHPFQAGCGKPNRDVLLGVATSLNDNFQHWRDVTEKRYLDELWPVLGCKDAAGCKFASDDKAVPCTTWSQECNAPVTWTGQFSFASGASEAFLLEYANAMPVDWGSIPMPPPATGPWNLRSMIGLHEFFFDQTDRHPNVAPIEASNLVREIYDQIHRKVDGKTMGKCPRMPQDSQFVGLVGHDTNLAGVGTLLNLGWRFDDPSLPPDTRGLPPNDALPAGALVFELRRISNGKPGPAEENYFVRVVYLTQGLLQMRELGGKVFGLRVQPADARLADPCLGTNPCELPLKVFDQMVQNALMTYPPFLSGCAGEGNAQVQVCGAVPQGAR